VYLQELMERFLEVFHMSSEAEVDGSGRNECRDRALGLRESLRSLNSTRKGESLKE
jgi:hypothetical protein